MAGPSPPAGPTLSTFLTIINQSISSCTFLLTGHPCANCKTTQKKSGFSTKNHRSNMPPDSALTYGLINKARPPALAPRAAPSASFSRRRFRLGQRAAVPHDPHAGAAAHAVWQLAACRLPLRNPRAGSRSTDRSVVATPKPRNCSAGPGLSDSPGPLTSRGGRPTHRPAAKPRPLAVDFSTDALRRGRRIVLAPAG